MVVLFMFNWLLQNSVVQLSAPLYLLRIAKQSFIAVFLPSRKRHLVDQFTKNRMRNLPSAIQGGKTLFSSFPMFSIVQYEDRRSLLQERAAFSSRVGQEL